MSTLLVYPYNIAIFGGTGAVGAYFVKQFNGAGYHVSIIGKPNSPNLQQIKTEGLTIISSEGKHHISRSDCPYMGDFSQFPKHKKQKLVIVSVKQFDWSEKLAQEICEITDENSIIAVIINGLPFYFLRGLNLGKTYLESVDPTGRISQLLKNRQIIGLQPIIAAEMVSPGIVHIRRPLPNITVTIGSPENKISREAEELHRRLNAAGIKTTLTQNIREKILEKHQFTLAINTLSAKMERNIGDVFDAPETQNFIQYAITLINQMAQLLNLGKLRSYQEFKKISITKEHYSSLHHDIQAGKPGEIAAIVDATIELAEHLRLRFPHAELLSTEPLKDLKHLLESKKESIAKVKNSQQKLRSRL